jgi:hypothetical protein
MPYQTIRTDDTLSGFVLKPGYNKFEAIIQDSTTQETISKTTNFRFFRFQEPSSSMSSPSKPHAGWGELQINKSIDGHTFHVQEKLSKMVSGPILFGYFLRCTQNV